MFSAPNRWLIVGLLFAAMAVSYIDRGNMAVAAPVLMREFRLSKTGIGVVLSVFFWAYALMQIPAGWLIDRFDVKITYAVGYTFWCLVAAGTSLVGSVGGLMLARGLLAVGESASTPASHRAICSMFSPRERGFPTGVYMAATKLGPAIGTALGAYFLVRFGWRGLFACTGLAGLLWLLPWLSLYPASPERVTREKKGQSSGSGLQKLLDPWRKRNIWGIFFGFFCYGYIWHVYDTWLPTYLVSERKMSLSQMGFWGPLPFVAFAISVSVGGLLSRSRHRSRLARHLCAQSFHFRGPVDRNADYSCRLCRYGDRRGTAVHRFYCRDWFSHGQHLGHYSNAGAAR